MTRAKGNMYEEPPVTHTHNDIQGKCPHGCTYCYMKEMWRFGNIPAEVRLSEKSRAKSFGKNHFIFMGTSCDMWANDVPDLFIYEVLKHAKAFNGNKYLFQSKNPARFIKFLEVMPKNFCLGTTIETNRIYPCMGKTPTPTDRAYHMNNLHYNDGRNYETFITIEPILDFDLNPFASMLYGTMPDFINIGADSCNNHLPEPEPEKIRELIKELEKFTKVNLKKNLKRLLPESGKW